MLNKLNNILNEYVQGLVNIIGDDLDKVILYGSYARGEQSLDREISDIDIMILIKSNNVTEVQAKVIDYCYDLDLQYDILLSPIVENTDIFNIEQNLFHFIKMLREKVFY